MSQLFFHLYRIAGNVFATLAEKKPDEDKNRTTENKETDLDRKRPAGSKENKGVDNAKADSVKIAAGEDDFFGQREITVSEGVFSAIIWVTEKFAIEDEFERTTNDGIIDNHN